MSKSKTIVKSKPSLTTDLTLFNKGLSGVVTAKLGESKAYDEFASIIVKTCNAVGAKSADYFDYNSQTKDKSKLSPVHAFIDARRIDTKDRMMLPVAEGGAGYKDNLVANTIWSRDVWPRVLALVSPVKAAKLAKEKAAKAEARKGSKGGKGKPGKVNKSGKVTTVTVKNLSTEYGKLDVKTKGSIIQSFIAAEIETDNAVYNSTRVIQALKAVAAAYKMRVSKAGK